MTERVLGPTGSPRRRWAKLLPLVAAIAVAASFIPSAVAVHDVGLFQLDGNAVGGAPGGPNDWNNIFPPPGNTTTAIATSFNTDPFNTPNDNVLTGG